MLIPEEGLSEYRVQNTQAGHRGFSFPSDPGDVATGLLVVGFDSGLEHTDTWESDGESLTKAESCLFACRFRHKPEVEIVLEPFRTGEKADTQCLFGGPNVGFKISSIEKLEHLGTICSFPIWAWPFFRSMSDRPYEFFPSPLMNRILFFTFHRNNKAPDLIIKTPWQTNFPHSKLW